MSRFSILICAILTTLGPGHVRAEFIANVLVGDAENVTRTAAAHAFEGYRAFYAGMALLERRAVGDAQGAFQTAINSFQSSRGEYDRAASLLKGKQFSVSKLAPPQAAAIEQFLNVPAASDQATIMTAYAQTFDRATALIAQTSPMTLGRFREIQTFLGRQILVGTFISEGLRQ